jgi:Protein of unknown function (DUF3341)
MRNGTLFEFSSPAEILAAAAALRGMGFTRLEAYTPYAVPELEEALAIPRSRIPRAVFVAAAFGCALAFAILWFTNAYDYPLDVGGRPLNSIPADIPIMFETTVLLGSLTAFALALVGSGLPRLHHPAFEVPGFESASIDRFWLAVGGPPVDDAVRFRMRELGAGAVRSMEDRS